MNFLSTNIRYLRYKLTLNQSEFGKLFNCSRDNIASYESGTTPKIDVIYHITKYFNITFEIIYTIDLTLLPNFPTYQSYEESIDDKKGTCKSCQSKLRKIDDLQKTIDVLTKMIEILRNRK